MSMNNPDLTYETIVNVQMIHALHQVLGEGDVQKK